MILNILLVFIILLLSLYVLIYYSVNRYILPIEKAPSANYALVLGAGLEKDGSPSDILMDRIRTGVDLYKTGKVKHLIMSGSCRRGLNEPDAMIINALDSGIPESALLVDTNGVNTLNSCINVKQNYAPYSLIIITQQFHLPRAIFLQRALGVKAVGIAAHFYHFSWYKNAYWYAREMLSLPYNLIKLTIYLH